MEEARNFIFAPLKRNLFACHPEFITIKRVKYINAITKHYTSLIMHIAISKEKLFELLSSQVRNNFLLEKNEQDMLHDGLDGALAMAETCFSYAQSKYYRQDGQVFFNPYHSAQYCIFCIIFPTDYGNQVANDYRRNYI